MLTLVLKHFVRFYTNSFRASSRDTGIVKRFSKEKGFGFITRDRDGVDVFVHFRSIIGSGFQSLEEGQKVEFNLADSAKGQEARNVNVIDLLNQTRKQDVSSISTDRRHTGIVRRFNKERGFGFITRRSDGADFFVHARSIKNPHSKILDEGMQVEFRAFQGNRSAEALDVHILDISPKQT